MAVLRRLLSCLLLVPVALACSSSKKSSGSSRNKTPEGFCENFAKAACNETVVGKCSGGGTDIEKCVAKQSSFCMGALGAPTYYSPENAQQCIEAVGAAYEDAKLTADEIKVVRELAAPCDQLIAGPGVVNAICSGNHDCNSLEGLSCVIRPGQTEGSCQVPQIVGGGFSCVDASQVCDSDFYCDGQNCIARPNTEAASCSPDKPCTDEFKCIGSTTSAICTAKSGTGETCSGAIDCISGVCSGSICVEQVELTTAEPLCSDLR